MSGDRPKPQSLCGQPSYVSKKSHQGRLGIILILERRCINIQIGCGTKDKILNIDAEVNWLLHPSLTRFSAPFSGTGREINAASFLPTWPQFAFYHSIERQ